MKYKDQIVEWWQSLNFRDQCAVGIGGTLLSLYLLLTLTWFPFVHYVSSLQSNLLAQQKLVAYMQPAVQQILIFKRNNPENQPASAATLLNVLEQGLKEKKLKKYVGEFNQVDENQVHVKLNQVPFDGLSSGLIFFWQNYQIKVLSCKMMRGNTEGLVDADLVFTTA